jgi:hypothetical protein
MSPELLRADDVMRQAAAQVAATLPTAVQRVRARSRDGDWSPQADGQVAAGDLACSPGKLPPSYCLTSASGTEASPSSRSTTYSGCLRRE